MDYDFIENNDLVGMRFYNPSEYYETGCVYTIIEELNTGADYEKYIDYDENPYIKVSWFCTRVPNWHDQTTKLGRSEFLQDLKSGWFVLMLDEEDDMFNSLNEDVNEIGSDLDWSNIGIYFDETVTKRDIWEVIRLYSGLGFKNGVTGSHPWVDRDVDTLFYGIFNDQANYNAIFIDSSDNSIVYGECKFKPNRKCIYYKDVLDLDTDDMFGSLD